MICPSCRTNNPATARFCDNCGKGLAAAVPRAAVGGNPSAVPVGAVRNNGLAIAGLVLGIVGVLFGIIPIVWYVAIPAAILALVFGYIGRRQIADSGGTQSGRGMTTAAIVMGWVGVGLIILWVLVFIGILSSLSNIG